MSDTPTVKFHLPQDRDILIAYLFKFAVELSEPNYTGHEPVIIIVD